METLRIRFADARQGITKTKCKTGYDNDWSDDALSLYCSHYLIKGAGRGYSED